MQETAMTQPAPPTISDKIARTLSTFGDKPLLEYDGIWYSRAELAALANQLLEILDARCPGANRIGLIVRNRPVVLAAILGLIVGRRTIVMLNAAQTPERLASEIAALRLAAVVGEERYWGPSVAAAARDAGMLQLNLPDTLGAPVVVGAAPANPVGSEANGDPAIALELLSSGTTGVPKRVPILWRTLEAALNGAHGTVMFEGDEDVLAAADLPPSISGLSLGNIGGIYILLPSALIGQRIVMLEKFAVAPWAKAVEQYEPEILSVQPVGLRMILDADVPPAAISSLKWIVSGASHLDPDLQDRFEQRYGSRVFGAYGATEFCGSIVMWDDALYDQFRDLKRGSVGRPAVGVDIRIIDLTSEQPAATGAVGRIEAKVDRVGPDWIKTTDLGYLDTDGFLFITGRSDDAINRGGYKVVPTEVIEALRAHPAVLDAAVVGLPDARLGEVPVAAVEIREGHAVPSEEELRDFARTRLLSYQVPAQIRTVDALPRNASLKVMAPAIRELFSGPK
jgi:long-chain acyl-CoA synthetase